jgi:hypothetical protein
MKDVIVDIATSGFEDPGVPIHFYADFKPGCSDFSGVGIEYPIYEILKVVADANQVGMFHRSNQGYRLFGHNGVIAGGIGGMNM